MSRNAALIQQLRVDLGLPEEDDNAMEEHRLLSQELFWRDHYFWLKEKGYVLRPRFHPEWVASWKGLNKTWFRVEDGQLAQVSRAVISHTKPCLREELLS